MASLSPAPEAVPRPPFSTAHVRWVVCALLFFAATINYVDRQVISILKPTLMKEFGWQDERIYASIVFTFQMAYAIGLLIAGRVMDWLGTRIGFAIAIVLWSVAAVGHAAADHLPWLTLPTVNLDFKTGLSVVALSGAAAGFALMRFLLGLGEAGNFPAAIKTVAEWFPRKERALATGIFNSGTNVGALLTPLVAPWVARHWGWQWAFVVTGVLGFGWLVWWMVSYKPLAQHPTVSEAERAYILSDPPEPVTPVPWARLMRYPQAWAFAVAKFMTDPIWWLYLFWIPDFFSRPPYNLDLTTLGPPIIAIYLMADVGSIGGGWLSSTFIRRGWSVNAARKTAMLVCGLAVVPIVFAARTRSLWIAAPLIGLAAAAHQGWSANLFTLTSDMFPRRAVGSVVGFGGMAGAVGGMLISIVVGEVLHRTGSYMPIFLMAGFTYLAALVVVHLLAPRLAPARIDG